MSDLILRYGVFPLLDLVTGCLRKYLLLNRLQWNENALQKWQDDRTRALVTHAYSTVPFYRAVYDSEQVSASHVKKTEDLSRLPIVSKGQMKNSFPDKTTSYAISKGRRRLAQTSGTGKMFEFYDDTSARGLVIASRILFESWMGLGLGDRTAMLTDMPDRRTILLGEVRVPVSRLSDDPWAAVRLIRSLRPCR